MQLGTLECTNACLREERKKKVTDSMSVRAKKRTDNLALKQERRNDKRKGNKAKTKMSRPGFEGKSFGKGKRSKKT
jgi:hypothetical protein